MSNVITCDDILAVVSMTIYQNEQLRIDHDNKISAIQNNINNLSRERDSIQVPSTVISDYQKKETTGTYACDAYRRDLHTEECKNTSFSPYPSGSFQFSGNETTTWGSGPCRTTKGECVITQDYIDGEHDKAIDKINNLNSRISTLEGTKTSLVLLPVPDISCCQSIGFNNIAANKITFDDISQSCSVQNSNGETQTIPSNISGDASGNIKKATTTKSSNMTITTNTALIIGGVVLVLVILIIIIVSVSKS